MFPVRNRRITRGERTLMVTTGAGAKSNTPPSQNATRSGSAVPAKRRRR